MFSSFPNGDLRPALRSALRASFSCLSRVLFSVIPQIASALSSSPIFSSCLAVRIFQWNGPGKWNMPDLHAYDPGVAWRVVSLMYPSWCILLRHVLAGQTERQVARRPLLTPIECGASTTIARRTDAPRPSGFLPSQE